MNASLPEEIFGPLPKPLHLGISVSNLETKRRVDRAEGISKERISRKEILAQHGTQGIVHFAFEVADVDATATVLRARAIKFACEPTNLAELGVRYFHIYDCDGNLLEFGQRI
jgi:catechol 2,3-dioxygenase-like lactoylglutathione lyase family enzyme